MNCEMCDNVFKCNGEIHDNCHINDEGLVCPDCVEMGKCDCEHCREEVHCCGTCGCDLDEEYWKSFAFEQSTTEPNEVYCSSKCEPNH